ncbi:hypothetical protein EBB07_01840 [Paenibacillaceae bacterium]|nr:hypothetical protein EBB07_01840 [Paenibacillaceae bacterium]
MERIYPITEEYVSRFCGQVVCAVMEDGTRHIGVLSSCRGGQLYFNEENIDDADTMDVLHKSGLSKRKPRSKRKKTSVKGKALTKAFPGGGEPFGSYPGPYGPGGFSPFRTPFVLDLALIALLFLFI